MFWAPFDINSRGLFNIIDSSPADATNFQFLQVYSVEWRRWGQDTGHAWNQCQFNFDTGSTRHKNMQHLHFDTSPADKFHFVAFMGTNKNTKKRANSMHGNPYPWWAKFADVSIICILLLINFAPSNRTVPQTAYVHMCESMENSCRKFGEYESKTECICLGAARKQNLSERQTPIPTRTHNTRTARTHCGIERTLFAYGFQRPPLWQALYTLRIRNVSIFALAYICPANFKATCIGDCHVCNATLATTSRDKYAMWPVSSCCCCCGWSKSCHRIAVCCYCSVTVRLDWVCGTQVLNKLSATSGKVQNENCNWKLQPAHPACKSRPTLSTVPGAC